jgi:hypothetical protein
MSGMPGALVLAVTLSAAAAAQSVHPRDRQRPPLKPEDVRQMTDAVPDRYKRQIIREAHYRFGLVPTGIFFAQIHQESRFSDTARSGRGARGLAQFMGPTATAMQRNYASQLDEFCRERGGCPLNPQWAIRAMLLLDKENFRARRFAHGDEQLAFMLADYNGGVTALNTERDYCAQTRSCDPDVYFNGVALACGKATTGRPRAAVHCRENTAYPERILYVWRPVYHRWLAGQ